MGFAGGLVKNLLAMQEPQETWVGSLVRSRRSFGGGNDNPFRYSCLENPMDRGDWWAMVHGVTESGTTERLSTNAHTHIPLYICTRSSSSIYLSVDI